MGRIFVDSNIFVFAEVAEFAEHKISLNKLSLLKEDNVFLIDTIVASELHYKLARLLGATEGERRSSNILNSPFIIYEPVLITTMKNALRLSRRYGIKTNDAIIAQHCLDLRVGGLLTDNVKDFARVKGIRIVSLRD